MTGRAAAKPTDSNDYETPFSFYRRLDDEFGFTMDAFATSRNAKCALHFTREFSAFEHEWTRESFPRWVPESYGPLARSWRAFANPPYDRLLLGRAVRRMAEQSAKHGIVIVGLVPPSTSTKWWHETVMTQASEVRAIKGRLQFEYNGVPVKGNRGDSCVLVFRPGVRGPVFTSMEAYL